MTRPAIARAIARIILILITVALLALIATSCGVNYNLRRMAYHKRMAIAKGAEFKADTVYTDRVVITPGDTTTIAVPVVRDSLVTLIQDRIKIQYRIQHDTLRISVECPPDTVRIRVPVTVTETLCPPPDNKWKWIAGGLLLMLLVLMAVMAMTARRR